VQPRMLIVHASSDSPSQHLATMNAIFAAQKLSVLIDVVLLNQREDSMQLQQAAHLTGGLYLRPPVGSPMQRALAQYLLSCCLPDRYARQFVSAPQQGQLETRAICFLSKQALEVGFACSVCLAVFGDEKLPSCPVCATRFSLGPLASQLLKRKVAKKSPAALPRPAAVAGRGATPAPSAVPPAPTAESLAPAAGSLAPWQATTASPR